MRTLSHMSTLFDDQDAVSAILEQSDTAEAVFGLQDEGELLLQCREGAVQSLPASPGRISYAGGGWAHRVVNTSDQELHFLAISGANIDHDYETSAALNFKPSV